MYLCSSCWYASATKLWKCPDCSSFGTFQIDPSAPKKKGTKKHKVDTGRVLQQHTNTSSTLTQYALQNKEFLRLFPSWITGSGIYLLGGEPGIGKSTLMLQFINELQNNNNISIGYFSGEETAQQILSRNERILNTTWQTITKHCVPPLIKGG